MKHTWRYALSLFFVIITVQCLCSNPSELLSISSSPTQTNEASMTQVIPPPIEIPTTSTPLPTVQPTATILPAEPSEDTQPYDVVQTVRLINNGPGSARIVFNLVLVYNQVPYQQVVSAEISPSIYEVNSDEYGNQYARFEIPQLAAGDEQVFTARYRVMVNPIKSELGSCTGDMPTEYTSPETYIESDSQQVIDLAARLGDGKPTACEKTRAYYEYITSNITYYGYRPEEVGALATLSQGTGDCTDYADVMIALSRASGIPARFIEGVTCCTDNGYVEGNTKHDWTEVYLPSSGWVPVDPTYGQQPGQGDNFFATLPPDRIIVSRGQNLRALNGYHYWSYTYWYDQAQPDISNDEEWSILKVP
jgi:transglutaminase-like putative cysteine protease